MDDEPVLWLIVGFFGLFVISVVIWIGIFAVIFGLVALPFVIWYRHHNDLLSLTEEFKLWRLKRQEKRVAAGRKQQAQHDREVARERRRVNEAREKLAAN